MYYVDNLAITDPYDPRLGILLEPGLDHHFDRHEISIFVQVPILIIGSSNIQGSHGTLHVFKTPERSAENDWVPSARFYHGKPIVLDLRPSLITLLDHHYRHSLLLAWGSTEVQNRLTPSGFIGADDDELANMYHLELLGDFPTPPSSSAIFPFYSECHL